MKNLKLFVKIKKNGIITKNKIGETTEFFTTKGEVLHTGDVVRVIPKSEYETLIKDANNKNNTAIAMVEKLSCFEDSYVYTSERCLVVPDGIVGYIPNDLSEYIVIKLKSFESLDESFYLENTYYTHKVGVDDEL